MTAHTPDFLTMLGTTHIYVEHSTMSYHTFGAMLVGQSPIHVLTGLNIV